VEHLGGADKLLALSEQINSMGGEQGFQESMAELGGWRELDDKWIAGDPAFVETLAQGNPASFETIAPVMFGKLADVNPELYNNLGAQIIMQTFVADGTLTNIQLMKQALIGKNPELAGQYLDKIEKSLGGIVNLAQSAPKAKPRTTPQAEALNTERQQFNEERTQAFRGEVTTLNHGWQGAKITGELAAYLNGAEKKITPALRAKMDRDIGQYIWDNHLANNPTFMKQREALMGKRDREGLVRLYKQYANDKLWATTTRQVCADYNLSPASKRPPVPTVQGNKGPAKVDTGFQRVSKFPKPQEVDRSLTTYDMGVNNQFVLKDGRRIQVVEPRQ